MSVSRHARLGRGMLAATFAVAMAAISHSVAGGSIASPLSVVLGLALAAMVCVPLAARRMSWPALVAGVGVSQILFHMLFEFFGPAVAAPSMLPVAATAHDHAAMPVGAPALSVPVAIDPVHIAAHDAPLMWLAHAAAAVLTIAMLRRGEAAIWRLLELAVGWVIRRMPRIHLPVPLASHVARAVDAPPFARLTVVLLDSLRYRGPPAVAA